MKYFVTVGTQLPFDRMIKLVDSFFTENNITNVTYQIGKGDYIPNKGAVYSDIEPQKFDDYCKDCDVIISHAGIGSLLTASEYAKPVIIMPRLSKFKEHRNDHQLATVVSFSSLEGVYCFTNQVELEIAIRKASNCSKTLKADGCSIKIIDYIKELL